MGLPCMRWPFLLMALRRFSAGRDRIFRCTAVPYGNRLTPGSRVDTFFRKDLHTCYDDVRLRHCSSFPSTFAWMVLVSSLTLTTFLLYMLVISVSWISLVQPGVAHAINCALVATAIWKRVTILLNNIAQQSFSIHGLRIHQHNTIDNYFARYLGQRRYTVRHKHCPHLPRTNWEKI